MMKPHSTPHSGPLTDTLEESASSTHWVTPNHNT